MRYNYCNNFIASLIVVDCNNCCRGVTFCLNNAVTDCRKNKHVKIEYVKMNVE